MSEITQTCIAPWFGSNRSLAENVGKALEGCRWVGVGFAGGMSELLHIRASTIVVNDLHAHVLNLAAAISIPAMAEQMCRRLSALPYHPTVLAEAQERCREREAAAGENWFGGAEQVHRADLDWACDYFVCAWMSRAGSAGTKGEFDGTYSMRWDANGGDSNTRYRNAVHGIAAWSAVMRQCTFTRTDVLNFLFKAKDHPEHGVYCDPPFPEVGAAYKYTFDENDQRRLAVLLARFKKARVVVRFYDHPLVRELYPEPLWTWHRFEGRKQTNEVATEEVLLTRAGADS